MSLPGNYVSLNTENCEIYSEGSYNISNDLGQVKIKAVGNALADVQKNETLFNLMMIIDFYFDNGILKRMSKDLELYIGSLNPVPFEGDLFNHGIIELLGKERGDRALSELNLYGNYKKFPDELEKALVFNEVKMRYNEESKSYISQGQLGLGNVLKSEMFRYVTGVIQIKKQRGGDALDIYIEADPNTWYYFSYFKGTMLAISSNAAFNTDLQELKAKSKKMDVEKGPSYRFDLTNKKKKDLFLSKMKQLGAMGGEEKTEDEQ
jgi:hypothetical protein